jgi:hypothetical protein
VSNPNSSVEDIAFEDIRFSDVPRFLVGGRNHRVSHAGAYDTRFIEPPKSDEVAFCLAHAPEVMRVVIADPDALLRIATPHSPVARGDEWKLNATDLSQMFITERVDFTPRGTNHCIARLESDVSHQGDARRTLTVSVQADISNGTADDDDAATPRTLKIRGTIVRREQSDRRPVISESLTAILKWADDRAETTRIELHSEEVSQKDTPTEQDSVTLRDGRCLRGRLILDESEGVVITSEGADIIDRSDLVRVEVGVAATPAPVRDSAARSDVEESVRELTKIMHAEAYESRLGVTSVASAQGELTRIALDQGGQLEALAVRSAFYEKLILALAATNTVAGSVLTFAIWRSRRDSGSPRAPLRLPVVD